MGSKPVSVHTVFQCWRPCNSWVGTYHMWGPCDSHNCILHSLCGHLLRTHCLLLPAWSVRQEKGSQHRSALQDQAWRKEHHEATGHKLSSVCGPEARNSCITVWYVTWPWKDASGMCPKVQRRSGSAMVHGGFEWILDQPVGCEPRLSECYLWV